MEPIQAITNGTAKRLIAPKTEFSDDENFKYLSRKELS